MIVSFISSRNGQNYKHQKRQNDVIDLWRHRLNDGANRYGKNDANAHDVHDEEEVKEDNEDDLGNDGGRRSFKSLFRICKFCFAKFWAEITCGRVTDSWKYQIG